ncbi:MAG: ChaN family lipoprotein [Archangium sp.]
MRSSLSLQRSLYEHQARQIAQQVQSASPRFRAYQRRYEAATKRFRRPIELTEVDARVAKADLVYVGDYHTLRMAQAAYLALVKNAVKSGRRVVLALEFVETRHQSTLDSFLQGKIGEKTFLSRIGHPYRGPFDIWPGFAPILQLAKDKKLEVIAIDRRASGPRSLELRDVAAARPIARAAKAADRPLVITLMGQYHVAPMHLPKQVEALLGDVKRESLVVYQNAEGIYWSLARRGLVERTRAVEISARELCLVNTSPVVSQRSFLDYVEAEAGDAPIDESGISLTFRHLAQGIARFSGLKIGDAIDDVLVLGPGDFDALQRISRRARFTAKELKHLEKHVLSLESAWIPRARAVWLSSMSLNDAAEEAAHFVRHCCVGDDMERPRPRTEAFWAQCLEEALGFFGSRLVNPKRRAVTLDEWSWHFQNDTGELKQAAAFTLAISTTLRDDVKAAQQLIPQDDELMNGVSHALGYLLGDALSVAFSRKKLSAADVRALFRDRFEDPAVTFAALVRRFDPFGPSHETVRQPSRNS